MVIDSIRQMTVAEYLAFDEESELKNEYINGEVYPMTGGTLKHAAIIANTSGELRQRLKGSDCQALSSDMRIRVDRSRYLYPDLSVVCGEPVTDDSAMTLHNPTLIAEVTSPSTVDYDRVAKRRYYQAIAFLQIYLVIDQHRALVELYLRQDTGWHLQEFYDLEAAVPLSPFSCDLPMADIYYGIQLDAAERASAAEK